jgi:hypothetical protein
MAPSRPRRSLTAPATIVRWCYAITAARGGLGMRVSRPDDDRSKRNQVLPGRRVSVVGQFHDPGRTGDRSGTTARPRDLNALAKSIVDKATSEEPRHHAEMHFRKSRW